MRAASMFAAMAMLTACASPAPAIQTGPGAETTFDGLVKVDNTAMKQVWVRPDTDIGLFTKILPVITGIQYAPAKESRSGMYRRSSQTTFPLSDKQKERFEKAANEIFLAEFAKSEKFQLTDQPGDDVLLVRVELLEVSSRIPPDDGPGRMDVYLNDLGAAVLVLEVYDSGSKQILARATDSREFSYPGDRVQRSTRGLEESQVRRGLEAWGRVMVSGLDSMKN